MLISRKDTACLGHIAINLPIAAVLAVRSLVEHKAQNVLERIAEEDTDFMWKGLLRIQPLLKPMQVSFCRSSGFIACCNKIR